MLLSVTTASNVNFFVYDISGCQLCWTWFDFSVFDVDCCHFVSDFNVVADVVYIHSDISLIFIC